MPLPTDFLLGAEFDVTTEDDARHRVALLAMTFGRTVEERAMLIDMLGVRS